jgi:uncharacterized protein (TIGR03435 family)
MVRSIALLALCAIPAFSQPAFEVASLKRSQPSTAPLAAQMAQDRMLDSRPPGWLPIQRQRLSFKNRPLAGLIASAFRVRPPQISAPAWTREDRYDIEATFPADTPREAVNDMMRTLLEERFGLKTHRDEKEESGYALVETKDGVKLTPSAPSTGKEAAAMSEEDRRAAAEKMHAAMQKRMEEKKEAAANGGTGFSSNNWQGSATLSQLADWLTPLLGRPVVDATGVDGKYDFNINIRRFGDDTEDYAAAQALAKLGLKLVARKIAVSTVVVDHADRAPKPN